MEVSSGLSPARGLTGPGLAPLMLQQHVWPAVDLQEQHQQHIGRRREREKQIEMLNAKLSSINQYMVSSRDRREGICQEDRVAQLKLEQQYNAALKRMEKERIMFEAEMERMKKVKLMALQRKWNEEQEAIDWIKKRHAMVMEEWNRRETEINRQEALMEAVYKREFQKVLLEAEQKLQKQCIPHQQQKDKVREQEGWKTDRPIFKAEIKGQNGVTTQDTKDSHETQLANESHTNSVRQPEQTKSPHAEVSALVNVVISSEVPSNDAMESLKPVGKVLPNLFREKSERANALKTEQKELARLQGETIKREWHKQIGDSRELEKLRSQEEKRKNEKKHSIVNRQTNYLQQTTVPDESFYAFAVIEHKKVHKCQQARDTFKEWFDADLSEVDTSSSDSDVSSVDDIAHGLQGNEGNKNGVLDKTSPLRHDAKCKGQSEESPDNEEDEDDGDWSNLPIFAETGASNLDSMKATPAKSLSASAAEEGQTDDVPEWSSSSNRKEREIASPCLPICPNPEVNRHNNQPPINVPACAVQLKLREALADQTGQGDKDVHNKKAAAWSECSDSEDDSVAAESEDDLQHSPKNKSAKGEESTGQTYTTAVRSDCSGRKDEDVAESYSPVSPQSESDTGDSHTYQIAEDHSVATRAETKESQEDNASECQDRDQEHLQASQSQADTIKDQNDEVTERSARSDRDSQKHSRKSQSAEGARDTGGEGKPEFQKHQSVQFQDSSIFYAKNEDTKNQSIKEENNSETKVVSVSVAAVAAHKEPQNVQYQNEINKGHGGETPVNYDWSDSDMEDISLGLPGCRKKRVAHRKLHKDHPDEDEESHHEVKTIVAPVSRTSSLSENEEEEIIAETDQVHEVVSVSAAPLTHKEPQRDQTVQCQEKDQGELRKTHPPVNNLSSMSKSEKDEIHSETDQPAKVFSDFITMPQIFQRTQSQAKVETFAASQANWDSEPCPNAEVVHRDSSNEQPGKDVPSFSPKPKSPSFALALLSPFHGHGDNSCVNKADDDIEKQRHEASQNLSKKIENQHKDTKEVDKDNKQSSCHEQKTTMPPPPTPMYSHLCTKQLQQVSEKRTHKEQQAHEDSERHQGEVRASHDNPLEQHPSKMKRLDRKHRDQTARGLPEAKEKKAAYNQGVHLGNVTDFSIFSAKPRNPQPIRKQEISILRKGLSKFLGKK